MVSNNLNKRKQSEQGIIRDVIQLLLEGGVFVLIANQEDSNRFTSDTTRERIFSLRNDRVKKFVSGIMDLDRVIPNKVPPLCKISSKSYLKLSYFLLYFPVRCS